MVKELYIIYREQEKNKVDGYSVIKTFYASENKIVKILPFNKQIKDIHFYNLATFFKRTIERNHFYGIKAYVKNKELFLEKEY